MSTSSSRAPNRHFELPQASLQRGMAWRDSCHRLGGALSVACYDDTKGGPHEHNRRELACLEHAQADIDLGGWAGPACTQSLSEAPAHPPVLLRQ